MIQAFETNVDCAGSEMKTSVSDRENERRTIGRWIVVFAALFGLVSCKSSPETKTPPPSSAGEGEERDVARFRFDWREGTTLTAEVDRELRRAGGESKTFHAGYSLGTTEEGDGYRIDVTPEFDIRKTGTNRVRAEDAVAVASVIALPTLVVGPDGAFRSVADVDESREDFREAVRQLDGGALTSQETGVLEPVLDEQYLEDRARQFWSLLVGTWAESQLEVGETTSTEVSDSFAFPMIGRREVVMELEIVLEERLPCASRSAGAGRSAGTTGDSRNECVRISMKSRPDVETLETSMQQWVDQFAEEKAKNEGMNDTPDLEVTDVFLRTEFELVTKPATLRPRRFRQKRTVRMTLQGPSGSEKSYRLVDERRTEFREE